MKFCSIIIPFKNSQRTIRKCLNSALHQIGNIDYDIILINDYSEDKSNLIVKKIIKSNKNCYLINSNKKTIGPGHARNLGINKSKSKYLFFLDSDDYIKKNLLKKLFYKCNKNNYDFKPIDFVRRTMRENSDYYINNISNRELKN